MIRLSMRKIHHANVPNNTNRHLILKLCCVIMIAFIFVGIPYHIVKAEASLKLYNYSAKATTTYTGKQVITTLNGSTIACKGTPGILVNGVSLLPYYEIFQTSGIAADCVYNKTKGTVTISKYNTSIVMTIGSKSAKVNDKAVTLSVAPMKVKYIEANKTCILIPSRFVSETLGLGYSWNSEKNTVSIVKHTIQLSYNGGEKFEYSGTKGSVTIDGKSVKLGTMPSIIMNDTAMLRAKAVFAASIIDADYIYNKADQSVTLSKNGNVLVMTIGSKTAYLNDKKVSLSTAPVLVKNHETNSSYVMVPGSFTTTSLGYTYQWNNSARTSAITTRSDDPELGDSGEISDTGTILKEWNASTAQYGISSGVHTLNSDAAATNNYGTIYNVFRDYTNSKLNSETFMIPATVPYNKVTSSSSGTKISLQADAELCNSQTYQMYGITSNFVNTINLINNTAKIGTTIEFNLRQNNYQYDIALSSDKMTLYVTVYYNSLKSVMMGTNKDGDYLVMNGTGTFNASVTEASGFLYIDLPYTINNLGDITSAISGSKYINQIYSINSADKTQLILSLYDGYTYSYKETGSKFTIIFLPKAGIDPGKYEIVIPKPTGVTSSMISDEDYYFSNYFVVTLQGDYTAYYLSNFISNKASAVNKISISLNSNGNTEIKIATSKLQGYEIDSDSNNIYVNVGDPQEIYKNIVVLDPGHGGTATGAIKNGNQEKNINFKILYTLGKKYFKQDTSKLKVYYTRTSDVEMSLSERAAFAKKYGADLFVSLHMNIVTNAPTACGTEIFYSKDNNSSNSAGLTSKILATMLLDNLYPAMGTSNRGVKEEAFTVIKKNTVPAVLIELGFLSNTFDYSIIMNEEKQDIAAKTIYTGLLLVFEQYPTGR